MNFKLHERDLRGLMMIPGQRESEGHKKECTSFNVTMEMIPTRQECHMGGLGYGEG